MTSVALAALLASPWIIPPVVTIWRIRRSRDLGEIAADPLVDAPFVSVIIPARDERRNIEACIHSALSATYAPLEVIVVDDRSSDGTGDVARAIAVADNRVRVIDNEELPEGWFGKPWACTTGASAARGEILCFADADTRHSATLVLRAVREMRASALDMLSVIGRQELGSFWENVVQPQVFWMLGMRYRGIDSVNRSMRRRDKIANGQCIFVRRDAYESVGGHGAVREHVAEDVALAQHLFASGKRTALILGHDELTTRMYTSLSEIMAGWRKNVFAGGREAMPWGKTGQAIFPALLVLVPLLTMAPPLAAVIAWTLSGPSLLLTAATIAVVAQLLTWVLVYRWMDAPVRYAPLYPLGAAIFGVIALQAIARGAHVEWKGRAYVTTSRAQRRSR